MSEPLLTVGDVAGYLAISPKSVRRHAAHLGASKIGGSLRFRQADIDAYVAAQRLLPERKVTPLGRRRAS